MQLCTKKKKETKPHRKKKDDSVQTFFAYEMLHGNQLKFSINVPDIFIIGNSPLGTN